MVSVESAIRAAVVAVEVAGITAILLGAAVATAGFLRHALSPRVAAAAAFRRYRQQLGRAILLGLEFLVAADIIATVALDLTPRAVGMLAGIVVIRTFLSFALEVELEGRWPWQRAAGGAP